MVKFNLAFGLIGLLLLVCGLALCVYAKEEEIKEEAKKELPESMLKSTAGTSRETKPLDCSSALSKFNLSNPFVKANESQRYFLAPVVHQCFKDNPYDISQLPMIVGKPFLQLPLEFNFKFVLMVDFANDGTLVMRATFVLRWNDTHRAWNKAQIPLKFVNIPAHEVWTPSFMLENCEEENCVIKPENDTKVMISYKGTILAEVSTLLNINCDMDLKNFPYDTQVCEAIFYMNDVTSDEIDLVKALGTESDPEFATEEWEVLNIEDLEKMSDNITLMEIPGEENVIINKVAVVVRMGFKRHPNFYLFTIIVPVVVLSIIGVCAVFLPAGSGDKMNLVTMVLLGFLFFQSVTAELFPRSDDSPDLAYYLLYALILSAVNLASCALVVFVDDCGQSDGKGSIFVDEKVLKPIFVMKQKIGGIKSLLGKKGNGRNPFGFVPPAVQSEPAPVKTEQEQEGEVGIEMTENMRLQSKGAQKEKEQQKEKEKKSEEEEDEAKKAKEKEARIERYHKAAGYLNIIVSLIYMFFQFLIVFVYLLAIFY